ncbi:MAG: DUF3786 domain-containing protein [Candidatus Omnitrophica bacterium]|nr:DUF3786 domain-containing protein [Candidatus Omnitrophota bacterium]
MAYDTALNNSWNGLAEVSDAGKHAIEFLADAYDINLEKRTVLSKSRNAPAKDYITILLLHYLIGISKKKCAPSGEWVSFKEMESGRFYYSAFYEGAIKPIVKKYGEDPGKLSEAMKKFGGRDIETGDAGIEISVFPDVPVRIVIWKGDEEFEAEATMLFDKSISSIFSTEDIAVLARVLAHSI